MSIHLGIGVNRFLPRGGGGVDVDAAAYIAAIRAVASVTPVQAGVLSNFYATEKAAGRWSLVASMFLHGWGVMTANAVDLKRAATGTFSATGISAYAGYVQGNMTGFFDTGAAPSVQGIYGDDVMFGVIAYAAPTNTFEKVFLGAYSAADKYMQLVSYNSTQLRVNLNEMQYLPSFPRANHNGVLIVSSVGGRDTVLRVSASGVEYIIDQYGVSPAHAAGPTVNFFVAARDQLGASPVQSALSDSKIGASFFGKGMSKEDVTAFASNSKTLWEALFGLALP